MQHLAILRIKNSDFDYTKYGLKNNFFSIDVSNAFNYTRNVGVTQYALLDGTVRIDNISREPANFTLQGLLGDVRGGNVSEAFVMSTAQKNRLQNQMDLLEALRDNGVFLDIITDERTYRNCIITGINFGKNRFGQIDAQLNIREAIMFGDEINVVAATANQNTMTFQEVSLLLDAFRMNSINTDEALVNEIHRIVTSSTLTTPCIISLGTASNNTDVTIPTYTYRNRKTSVTMPLLVGDMRTATDTNLLTADVPAIEAISGTVVGGNYLHVTFPFKKADTNLFRTVFYRESNLKILERILPDTSIHIRLLYNQDSIYSTQKGEVLKPAMYSDMVNGIHYLNVSDSTADTISNFKYGSCFIRKLKNNTYQVVPNLLGNDSRGFLYSATYSTTSGSNTILHPALIYIEERAWNTIKSELKRVWSASSYFRSKKLVI